MKMDTSIKQAITSVTKKASGCNYVRRNRLSVEAKNRTGHGGNDDDDDDDDERLRI